MHSEAAEGAMTQQPSDSKWKGMKARIQFQSIQIFTLVRHQHEDAPWRVLPNSNKSLFQHFLKVFLAIFKVF